MQCIGIYWKMSMSTLNNVLRKTGDFVCETKEVYQS